MMDVDLDGEWYGWRLRGRHLVSADGQRMTVERLRGLMWRDKMELRLKGYRQHFAKAFAACTYIYLTPYGTQPADAEFRSLRYLELARELIRALPSVRSAEGFDYARYFLAGVLSDLCRIRTAKQVDEVLQSNSFEIESLLEANR